MPLPRGKSIGLSLGRRIVADILHFSRSAPQIAVERAISIPEVAEARLQANPKPGWHPVFLKAFALAAMKVPELRHSLLTFPYTRIYEHACSVAAVTAERAIDGKPTVLIFQVRQPEAMPLGRLQASFEQARSAPVESNGNFRRMVMMAKLPRPVRRFLWWLGLRTSGSWRQKYCGTFASGNVVPAGATVLVSKSPLTTYFTFGPVDPSGSVILRLVFDHRVFDGSAAAKGLVETERALRSELLQELLEMNSRKRLAA